jgi:hypothetical protein
LLIPEAMPARSPGTADITPDVSGATSIASPRPWISVDGSTRVNRSSAASTRSSRSMPSPATIEPAATNTVPPNRSASAPNLPDSANSTMIGTALTTPATAGW